MPIWLFQVAASLLLLTAPCAAAHSPHLRSFTKSSSATKRVEALAGHFAVWVDESKWKQDKVDTAGVLEFSSVNIVGMGVKVIAEDTGVPTDRLRELVLANMKNAAPDAKIKFEEKRIVNGQPVLALKIAETLKGIPVTCFGYYYSGSSSTIQVMGYMIGSATRDIEELTDFLNGLEISDEHLPSTGMVSSGLLRFNSITVKFDPAKWEWEETDDPGKFTFTNSNSGSDDVGAMVLVERASSITIDALAKFAVSEFQNLDPKARIIYRKKCRVNGAKVWYLKIAAEVDKTPVMIFGYCYAGKAGTAQVYTIAKKSELPEYEKDCMEFLNGLVISE
jgi:hypothetical protein